MSRDLVPRKAPCASCPYRRDVPSGVWAPQEYALLPLYDGCTADQLANGAVRVFLCHQADGNLCAGWAGCHDMDENLAIRMDRDVDVAACREYVSPVPLFGSGAEACAHGLRDIESPGPDAEAVTSKIARVRKIRGRPLRKKKQR